LGSRSPNYFRVTSASASGSFVVFTLGRAREGNPIAPNTALAMAKNTIPTGFNHRGRNSLVYDRPQEHANDEVTFGSRQLS
jgi:hypothetical protein